MPAFMIGMPRSGTSILSEALSLHESFAWIPNYAKWLPGIPQLSLLNRITDIPKIGNMIRGKKQQRKRILDTVKRFFPRADEVYPVWEKLCGVQLSRSYLIDKKPDSLCVENVQSYFESLCSYQGKERFIAKFTGPPRIRFLSYLFPDASFINVVRDPRAVINSLIRVPFWKENGGLERPWWYPGFGAENTKKWHESNYDPIALAALQWCRIAEITTEESRILNPERYLAVRYEDFVQHPHQMLSHVFEMLGLAPSSRAHKYLDSAGKLVNMNRKFEKQLTEEQIARIENITRPYAIGLGYNL